MITVICMDCKAHLGFKIGGDGISHGLCKPCHKIRMDEIEQYLLTNKHEYGNINTTKNVEVRQE